jgi:hypothetical protein
MQVLDLVSKLKELPAEASKVTAWINHEVWEEAQGMAIPT